MWSVQCKLTFETWHNYIDIQFHVVSYKGNSIFRNPFGVSSPGGSNGPVWLVLLIWFLSLTCSFLFSTICYRLNACFSPCHISFHWRPCVQISATSLTQVELSVHVPKRQCQCPCLLLLSWNNFPRVLHTESVCEWRKHCRRRCQTSLALLSASDAVAEVGKRNLEENHPAVSMNPWQLKSASSERRRHSVSKALHRRLIVESNRGQAGGTVTVCASITVVAEVMAALHVTGGSGTVRQSEWDSVFQTVADTQNIK